MPLPTANNSIPDSNPSDCAARERGVWGRNDPIEEILRVNQAGEYGAKRIYQGQLATIRDPQAKRQIQHMLAQELEHLDYFNKAVSAVQVRPTLLQPLWHLGGFVLGAVTALMGKEAAMACTVAVESVIDSHYQDQLSCLRSSATQEELATKIEQFRQEEVEHHDLGLAEGAEQAPAYPMLTAAIRGITKTAITLSKRI